MHTTTKAPPVPGGAVIRLRLDRFDELTRTLGLTSDSARASHVGIDRATFSRIRRGQIAPGERFISGCLAAFPGVAFEYLFALEAA